MKTKVSFMQMNPYIVDNIEKPSEKEIMGKEYITFGDDNKYPNYLYDLYLNTPTLQSAINSCVNYILGDEITSNIEKVNKVDSIRFFIENIARDFVTYGGFAFEILRNRFGSIAEIHHIDFKNLRTNKTHTKFFYSDNWSKQKWGRLNVKEIPKFNKDEKTVYRSIFYYSNTHIQTYPIPFWGSGVIAAEMERRINEFQLNSIINGFSASYIINLNNGMPSDEVKEEIERGFKDKFEGSDNSGRLVIAYNDNKDNSASIEAVPEDKLVDRYQEASKRCREQLLTAFRCHPVILGIPTEQSAFNDEDYQQGFALFNKTIIYPLQKTLVDVLNDVMPNLELAIKPFTIDFSEDGSIKNNEIIEE